MTLELRYAVRSDVGLLREGNEDSAYAGPRLLAVADGMGGHAAGEVASALTIASMAQLDSVQPSGDMLDALSDAVTAANARLQEKILANPAVEGMGTTLTALLWSDGHAAVCHIGDSRGYLLREGELYQITHDHTLVQSLVDEGRISVDDVATHPQRSLLLRALDGRSAAEPDLSVHDSLVAWVSSTSATMQVMLSGPPPCRASSISCMTASSGSVTVCSVLCRVWSVTTSDRPSEHSR